MTLASGDFTTQQRVAQWLASAPTLPSALLAQLISSMTASIFGKLHRARLYSQTFVRTFDGVGNYQLVLPDYPVTAISKVQVGRALIQPLALPDPVTGAQQGTGFGYGYRFVPWAGNLPSEATVLEFVNGTFPAGVQNIQVAYTAGYLIQREIKTIPSTAPYQITVDQPLGIWCRDNGVSFTDTGVALSPVTATPSEGQFILPPDSSPGLYTFSSSDAGRQLSFNYSFIPADLEEACIQMVAERYAYRSRIGEVSHSLGGQETTRFLRGSGRGGQWPDIPPEVEGLIMPYVNILPPTLGAPV